MLDHHIKPHAQRRFAEKYSLEEFSFVRLRFVSFSDSSKLISYASKHASRPVGSKLPLQEGEPSCLLSARAAELRRKSELSATPYTLLSFFCFDVQHQITVTEATAAPATTAAQAAPLSVAPVRPHVYPWPWFVLKRIETYSY